MLHRLHRLHRPAALAAVVAALHIAAAPLVAQSPAAAADTGTLLLRQGSLVVVQEHYVRTTGSLSAEVEVADGQRAGFSATLLPDGRVSRFEAREYAKGGAGAATVAQRATLTFRGDSVHIESSGAGPAQSRTFPSRANALPFLNPSPVLMGHIVRRARALGGERVEVPVFVLGGGGHTVPATVAFAGSDRATLSMAGIVVELVLDANGSIRSGAIPAQGITIERAP